jgi:acetyl esterase/lipase
VRYPAPLNDVRDALAWVVAHGSEYDVDPARIGAFGSSAGGHLAVQLAVTGNLDSPTRLKAVVDLSGPVDLTADGQKEDEDPRLVGFMPALLGCSSLAACPNAVAASPVDHVAAGNPPVFIVHSQDDFVPAAQGRELAERLTAVGTEVTFVVEPGGSHAAALLVRHPALQDRVVAFLRGHLG